jgi:hypothetical protein
MALTFSNVTVRGSSFDSNTCDFTGGAVHLDRASALYVYNTTFSNNTVRFLSFSATATTCILTAWL